MVIFMPVTVSSRFCAKQHGMSHVCTSWRQVAIQLEEALQGATANAASPHPEDMALVIDGKALQVALTANHKAQLLQLGLQCKVSAPP